MIRILHVVTYMNRGGAEVMLIIKFNFVEHTDNRTTFDEKIEQLGGKIYHCSRFTWKNYFIYKK